MIKISASILSADYIRLGEEIKNIEKAKIPYIHIDVMDGHFVPNISIGIPTVKSIRRATNLMLDVHLMISNPEEYIEKFAQAGADIINFHLEAVQNPMKIIEQIKKTGKKCAVTINPDTPAKELFGIIENVDMALVMSVYPGFGGQKFIPLSLDKIKTLYEYVKKNNLNTDIEVDGGIKRANIRDVLNAGANVIVVGSAIFAAEDMFEEVDRFNEIFREFDL